MSEEGSSRGLYELETEQRHRQVQVCDGDKRFVYTSSNERKVALVTGSATGIGANIAVDLVNRGYSVIVTGRQLDKLQKVVEQCKEKNVSNSTVALLFICDLLSVEQVDKLVDFVTTQFGSIDVLVNNACWRGRIKNILDDDPDQNDFKRVMHINVLMPMYLIHKLSPAVVVNMSSIASQMVVPLHLYSISKACLSEMSLQIGNSGSIISVTISPGPVLTDERPHHDEMKSFTLMNRVGSTQEISNLVMFVLSNAHLFNGKELFIDGGYLAKQKQ